MPLVFRRSLVLAGLALLSAMPSALHAQSLTFAGYGVRGGVSGSRFHGDYGDLGAPEHRLGISGSWFIRWRAGRFLSIQPEITYVTRGGKGGSIFYVPVTGPSLVPVEIRYEHRLDYLEVPFLLRVDVPTGIAVAPYLAAGPALSLLLDSSASFEVDGAVPSGTQRLRMADIFEDLGPLDSIDFKNTDVSIAGGGGVVIGRGGVRGVVDARYVYGLTNVLPTDLIDARNGSWMVTAGIELR